MTGLNPVLPFLVFFWKKARKSTKKKNKDFYPYRTPKIPGKEGKNAQKKKNKEILAGEKKQGIPKKKRKGRTGK